MIIEENINIKIKSSRHVGYFRKKGYECSLGDTISVKSTDIQKTSKIIIKATCDICGNIKETSMDLYTSNIKSNNLFSCCKKCSMEKTKLTNQKRYKCDNVFQNKEIKDKIKKDTLEKYGVEHHTQLKETIDKRKKTNMSIYGHEHHLQNENVLNKQKETNNEKYGVDCVFSSKTFQEKINETNINLYGDSYVLNNKEIKQKSENTRKKHMLDKYKDFGIYDIDYETNLYKGKCEHGHEFQIENLYLTSRIKSKTTICTECNPIGTIPSTKEIELNNYIKSIYNGEIIENDRKILNGKELDIFLPEKKLAFEFNGLYWHSELFKETKYHLNKTNDCLDKDIQLIHIYEDQWNNKKDIVKSRIKNILGLNDYKIYGRKCIIKEITNVKIVRTFLEENHIQGFCGSSIKLGLYYNGELVSLMTFGKLRKSLGHSSKKGSFELLRFCNKSNTNVLGGASKLFKHFIKNYDFNNIISYADRNWSKGDLYEKLGFDFDNDTVPNYYYIVDRNREYRYKFRKDILVKEGFDKLKSEHEIMIDRGYFRIYDSGNKLYTYNKKEL